MLGRILAYMLYIFVGINAAWYMICQDSSGFFTTIGFGDKLTSVSRWALNMSVHFIHSLMAQ